METESLAMLCAREAVHPDERFTYHSSRMRMHKVTKVDRAAARGDAMSTGGRVAIRAALAATGRPNKLDSGLFAERK